MKKILIGFRVKTHDGRFLRSIDKTDKDRLIGHFTHKERKAAIFDTKELARYNIRLVKYQNYKLVPVHRIDHE